MAGKKQAPAAKIEEDDDESWEDPVVDADGEGATPNMRMRDWRDVERYREIKELKQLVDDDLGIEELFENPLKPKPMPAPGPARMARATEKPKAAPPKPVPVAKPVAVAKPAPAPVNHRKKAPAKVRAKAHRR